MPIKPVTHMQPLPVETPDDVAVLVDILQRPDADVAVIRPEQGLP